MLNFALLALLIGSCCATPGSPVRPDYRYASAEAVEKWHDMKFGLRIHWGLYAITAIGPESWPLNADKGKNQTFLKWYWDQAKTWNPAKFDASKWIELMKSAGTKYFDFTTKHHEGFSMYLCASRQPSDDSMSACELSKDFSKHYEQDVFLCRGAAKS